MATNHYFNHFTSSADQALAESLMIESIKMYGMDVHYMPRHMVNEDKLWGESALVQFKEQRVIEMYIKSIDGFEGEGDFISKFGLEIKDEITLTVAKRRWTDLGLTTDGRDTSPKEGDLIYFPLTESLFEVKFVEDEPIFYQTGALQSFDLVCEMFNYSDEDIDTGVEKLDQIEVENAAVYEYTLDSATIAGTFTKGEMVYQGDNWEARTAGGEVVSWNTTTKVLQLMNITADFSTAKNVIQYPYGVLLEDGSTLVQEDEIYKILYDTTASYTLTSHTTSDAAESTTDSLANNVTIETEADLIIDFSEGNPFSDGNI